MASPYTLHKAQSFLRGLFGVAVMLWGVLVLQGCFGAAVVFLGSVLCATSFVRVIRIRALEQRLLHQSREAFTQLNRQTLPRRLYTLLLAVAEVGGGAEDRQRQMVLRLLQERYAYQISPADVLVWEAYRGTHEDIGMAAAHLRRILSPPECETVFSWACWVAFADHKFDPEEHAVLQKVARGLGIEPHRARGLFHQTKAVFLGRQDEEPSAEQRRRRHERRQYHRGWRGDGSTSQPPPRPTASGRRANALEVLGLDPDATNEQIRRRYRDLVKRFHPDRHAHLGQVAAEEANRRFIAIKAAYESLGIS